MLITSSITVDNGKKTIIEKNTIIQFLIEKRARHHRHSGDSDISQEKSNIRRTQILSQVGNHILLFAKRHNLIVYPQTVSLQNTFTMIKYAGSPLTLADLGSGYAKIKNRVKNHWNYILLFAQCCYSYGQSWKRRCFWRCHLRSVTNAVPR